MLSSNTTIMEKVADTLKAAPGAVAETAQSVTTGANLKAKDTDRETKDIHDAKGMTTDYGVSMHNTDVWLKVTDPNNPHGQGPALLEDPFAREKIHRFDHERIPERVVHARGAGAYGYFKLHTPIPEYSKAGILNDITRATPMFVRFSTVQGSRGSADTVRDVRGFALKFYTQEGNWDIVGNNIPVFFIQDAIKFPDFVHAVKPEPNNEIPQGQSAHNNFWDFQYLHTEATHMFMWAMSDRAIPRSFRMMQGFGVNTFTLINEKGERHFCKFIYTPTLGVHSLVWDEALKISGQDPDFHRKDLYEAIESGTYPTWRFGIQVLPESQQDEFDFDILDSTKIWPEDLVPIKYIGEFTLNRNVDDFFAETEQVAFCTSHVVPGIGFSDDPLLQGRNFSYFDTQISRLGINWEELPINRPVCPVMNFNRDGKMKHTIHKGKVNYWPNRFDAVPPVPESKGGYQEYIQKVAGIKARLQAPKFKEHFNQARMFYNSLSDHEKYHVQQAFAFELDHCDEAIVYERMCHRLADIDPHLAVAVSRLVGGEKGDPTAPPKPSRPVTTPTPVRTRGISQAEFLPSTPTIATRKVAILIADGYDMTALNHITAALTAAGAIPQIIAPRRGLIYPSTETAQTAVGGERKPWHATHHLNGMRSTLYDAVLISPATKESISQLSMNGRAVHWIREAFGHLKPIAALGPEAVSLVRDVALVDVKHKMEFSSLGGENEGKAVLSYGVVTQCRFDHEETWFKKWKLVRDEVAFLGMFAYQCAMHRCWEREMEGLNDMVAF